jgi:hypothetical protein
MTIVWERSMRFLKTFRNLDKNHGIRAVLSRTRDKGWISKGMGKNCGCTEMHNDDVWAAFLSAVVLRTALTRAVSSQGWGDHEFGSDQQAGTTRASSCCANVSCRAGEHKPRRCGGLNRIHGRVSSNQIWGRRMHLSKACMRACMRADLLPLHQVGSCR